MNIKVTFRTKGSCLIEHEVGFALLNVFVVQQVMDSSTPGKLSPRTLYTA